MKPYRLWKRRVNSSLTGITYYVMFATCPGKWINTGADNEEDALSWAEANRYDPPLNGKKKRITFNDFALGFFIDDRHGYRKRQDKKNKKYSEAYYRANEGRLTNYIMPFFGKYIISSITPRMIDDWLLDLSSTKSNRELSDNSKNKILYCFRIILGEAEEQGLIKDNPAQKVTPITERHKSRGVFTQQEISSLFELDYFSILKIWGTFTWYLFFKIQCVAGLRPGEVAGLSWGDFHDDHGGFVVSKSIDYSTGLIKGIKTEKKGMKEKIALLDQKTINDVKRLKKTIEDVSPLELIFTSTNNNTIKPEVSLKHFKASCAKAGIELGDRTQYSLRHTFDTDLLKSLSRDVVNDLMGHTSYRAEYDHRTGKDRLEQLQHVRGILDKKWGVS